MGEYLVDIGIIVHSQTVHAHSVAKILQENLSGVGHEVKVERVIPEGEEP